MHYLGTFSLSLKLKLSSYNVKISINCCSKYTSFKVSCLFKTGQKSWPKKAAKKAAKNAARKVGKKFIPELVLLLS